MAGTSIDLINSQIDVGSIVENLIYVSAAPVRRMQSQVSTLQSKIGAFQTINTKLSTLSEKVNTILFGSSVEPLVNPYTYTDRLSQSVFSKCTVASSDSNALSASADNVNAAGSYAITVNSLAQAKSMASSNFADSNVTKVGVGSITIATGSNDPVVVTIADSNNTLTGVANAINASGAGVVATIINDGSSNPYKLLLTANNVGTANAFTVETDLAGGETLSFAQTQAAADAQFVINGVGITKSSNTISDVIEGVTFTLKETTAGPVTLTVDKDIDGIVSTLEEFVSAYNTVNEFINSQFTYNAANASAGILAGDSTLRNIQSKLQNKMIQSVANRYSSFNVAGQVGLEFERNGNLALDESKLRDALSSNFTSVAAFFLGNGTPLDGATASDSRVTFNSKTAATQAGTYSIQVAALAEQAALTGNRVFSESDVLSADETLVISSGGKTATVSLRTDYSLAQILSSINEELSAQGMAVTAADDGTGRVKIFTSDYGSNQSVAVESSRSGDNSAGFGELTSAFGTDIAGTINGHEASGTGRALAGATGQPEEGLTVNIAQTAVGGYGSITVAAENAGVEGDSIFMNLHSILDGITDPLSGPIHNSQDALNLSIKYLNEEILAYQARLEVEEEMLTRQFNEADEALRLLQVTQSNLSSQLAKLSQ